MSVGPLQETKSWGLYEVDGSVFLNADRPTPTIGTVEHTGVKACNGPGLAAWKNSRR